MAESTKNCRLFHQVRNCRGIWCLDIHHPQEMQLPVLIPDFTGWQHCGISGINKENARPLFLLKSVTSLGPCFSPTIHITCILTRIYQQPRDSHLSRLAPRGHPQLPIACSLQENLTLHWFSMENEVFLQWRNYATSMWTSDLVGIRSMSFVISQPDIGWTNPAFGHKWPIYKLAYSNVSH